MGRKGRFSAVLGNLTQRRRGAEFIQAETPKGHTGETPVPHSRCHMPQVTLMDAGADCLYKTGPRWLRRTRQGRVNWPLTRPPPATAGRLWVNCGVRIVWPPTCVVGSET